MCFLRLVCLFLKRGKHSANIGANHSLWDHKSFMDTMHTWQTILHGQDKEQEISFRKHLRIASDKEIQKLLKMFMRSHKQTQKSPQNVQGTRLGGKDLLDSET